MATSATEAQRRESPEANGVERMLPAGDGRLPGLESADTLLLLSFGLAQLSVALTLFFDASLMDLSLRKYTFNILSGVFCPVTMFPWWLQPVSYAIPFTHGLILLRRVLDGETGIPLVDFAPLAAFSAGLVIGGHLALEAVLLHIRRRRSLCRY